MRNVQRKMLQRLENADVLTPRQEAILAGLNEVLAAEARTDTLDDEARARDDA